MKKLIFIISIFLGCYLLSPAQKSKVLAVFQLIETGKYEEAKEEIEEAIDDKKTGEWSRTWYAKGLLCQKAYQKGIAENDQKKYELYPDQLYLAHNSYQKARSLDKRGKLDEHLAPLYVLLANDIQALGVQHFQKGEYEKAIKAFEGAIQISQSPILPDRTDTNLLYNTALAAFENESWEKAIEYLNKLNKDDYSPNVPHLLYSVYLRKADTVAAEKVLTEGIKHYEDNEDLVLLLVDLFYHTNADEKALDLLDDASSKNPSNHIFHYTKGLIHQKREQYPMAIDAYNESLTLAPGETKIYTHIGTCYYNIGVEIEKKARAITTKRAVTREKEKSAEAFETAVTWLEKALERDPENQYVISKLNHLYNILGMSEKMDKMEGMLHSSSKN
jgi:tetratricopeptide (TPR) repeat protein